MTDASPAATGVAGAGRSRCATQHGQRALQRVEHHRQHGGAHAARPQHVRRADVAAADVAQIDPAPPRQQKRERNRPDAGRPNGDDENGRSHAASSPDQLFPAAPVSAAAARTSAPSATGGSRNSVIASTARRAERPVSSVRRAAARDRRPAGLADARQRQMRADTAAPPAATPAASSRSRDLTLHATAAHRGPSPIPAHSTRGGRPRRKRADPGEREIERPTGERRLPARPGSPSPFAIVDVADERTVTCSRSGGTQVMRASRREPRRASPRSSSIERRRGGRDSRVDLDGDEQPHLRAACAGPCRAPPATPGTSPARARRGTGTSASAWRSR